MLMIRFWVPAGHQGDPAAHLRRRVIFTVTAVATILCMMAVSVFGAGNDWFILKTDDHTPPPLDPSLAYVEEMGGRWLDRGASPDDPVIYLTFDAGYENGNVEKILDTLSAHGAHAAFFILPHLTETHTALVTRMAEEGHLVCNHSTHHRDMTEMSEAEIERELCETAALYKEKTGHEMAPFFRPPEGKCSPSLLQAAERCGYQTVFWSFAYADWDNEHQPDPEVALKRILDHTHNGMVLLLHPTSDTNQIILDRLLTAWEQEGYRFGTLDAPTAGGGA